MTEKDRLLAALRARIAADLEDLKRRQLDVQSGTTHEENRAEHAKDTRATEQSYLARGLAKRVAELDRTAAALGALRPRGFAPDAPVAVTALVKIAMEAEHGRPGQDEPTRPEHEQTWWIVAGAGGFELDLDGVRVRTLTPVSPLGRALLGLRAGDEGIVRTPRGERNFEVLRVS